MKDVIRFQVAELKNRTGWNQMFGMERTAERTDEIEGVYVFKTILAGTSFVTEKGTSRQKLLRSLRSGDVLELKPDFGHRHFRHLIAAVNRRGQDIGHLPSGLAAEIQPEMEAGHRFFAVVQELKDSPFDDGDRIVAVAVYRISLQGRVNGFGDR